MVRNAVNAKMAEVWRAIGPYRSSASNREHNYEGDGVVTKLIGQMTGALISITPVLGSTVRALQAATRGDKKGFAINAAFATLEGVSFVGGLRTTTVAGRSAGASSYEGVRAVSKYLQSEGMDRINRKSVIQSFQAENMSLRTANSSTYGLRFFGGEAKPVGSYLFPTFTSQTNRVGLALLPKWNNTMKGIIQLQIKPGSTYIFGRAASQGGIYTGGSHQIWVDRNNLIK